MINEAEKLQNWILNLILNSRRMYDILNEEERKYFSNIDDVRSPWQFDVFITWLEFFFKNEINLLIII